MGEEGMKGRGTGCESPPPMGNSNIAPKWCKCRKSLGVAIS